MSTFFSEETDNAVPNPCVPAAAAAASVMAALNDDPAIQNHQNIMSEDNTMHIGMQGNGNSSNGEQDGGGTKMCPEKQEEWANSLVGRWWEVYWDPDPEGKSDEVESTNEQQQQTAGIDLPVQDSAVLPQNVAESQTSESTPQSQENKPQIQQINVLYTGSRLGLSLQQIHVPSTTPVESDILNVICQYRTMRNQTQPLSYIAIKSILPDAVNGNLLQVNDIITGINGNSFYSPQFQSAEGGDFFNKAVCQLRDAKRPMIVNFERVVNQVEIATDTEAQNASSTNNNIVPSNYRKPSDRDLSYPAEPVEDLHGWKLRRIPRISSQKTSDTFYYSPQQNYKFRSKPEVSRFLDCLQQANGNEEVAIGMFRDQSSLKGLNEGDNIALDMLQQNQKRPCESETDEEECEDAIDWYDAKILSYNEGEFTVYFLGDEDEVTYTMLLSPEIVRPSVRQWATRTRALVDFSLNLSSKNDDCDTWTESFKSSLPSSTELPGDMDAFSDYYSRGSEDYKTSFDSALAKYGCQKIQEYKQMIAIQLHLVKYISPTNEETCEEEEEEEETNEPGPFANAFQVQALCSYLTEAQEACEWLLSDVLVWTLLKLLSEPNESGVKDLVKLSMEAVRSFLVNGARVLHRLMRADPASQKPPGRKKQRLGNQNSTTLESSFDEMLRSALMSDASMKEVMVDVTRQYLDREKNKCIDSAVWSLIDQTFNKIWKPVSDWISTAKDIIDGQSERRYSIGTIEKHTSEAETVEALRYVDISPWTIELQAKLSRLQFFEMETWSAMKACIQLNVSRDAITSTESVNIGSENDACFAALQRLKRESLVLPIRNVNPLGKSIVNAEGIHVPSPLTRTVIDDAITIRLWVLDLTQAKLLRERSSFIEDVIRRSGNALPKLPVPPYGGFGGNEAQPCAVLTENTKDSITILSANCYSYNHIIGNIGANLRSNINTAANDTSNNQFMQLATKSGVSSALVELKRLPILSVVEEKLTLRDELIDWNTKALDLLEQAKSCKLPYQQIKDLHNELVNIVDLKSLGRMKMCQNLRQSKSVDSEVRLFAVDDEKVICPTTGPWIREQYKKASDWEQTCHSIFEVLESHGFFSAEATGGESGSSLSLERINEVWDQHNDQHFASSFSQFERLTEVREKIMQWSSTFDEALTSDTLSLQERCNRLATLKKSRPNGVLVQPTQQTLDLWLRIYSWPLSVHEKVKLMLEQFTSWKANNQHLPSVTNEAKDAVLVNLMRTNVAPLLIEGSQTFLLIGHLPPSISSLRDEAIEFICGSNNDASTIKMDMLAQSTKHAKAGIDHIFNVKVDEVVLSSLVLLRVLFWKVMVKGFMKHVNNAQSHTNTDLHAMLDVNNAKALFSLCPRNASCESDIIEEKTDEVCLQANIRDADDLSQRSHAILIHASDLLRERSFMRKNELEHSVEALKSLQSSFKTNPCAALMLRSSLIEERISCQILTLRWMLNTMAYPLLWGGELVDENKNGEMSDNRIPLGILQDLYSGIPSKVNENESEVTQMISKVNHLINGANQWQVSCRALQNNECGKIAELFTIQSLAQASILSMAILPDENAAHEIYETALLMKDSLETKLLTNEKPNSHDVYKGKFPDQESLVGDDGDFLLFRLTGSLIYIQVRRALRDLKTVSEQLTVRTAEKVAYEWIVSIDEWIEALSSSVCSDNQSQLIITVENAQRLLKQGHDILYGVAEEVQDVLAVKQISIRPKPQKYSIVVMKGGAMTSPGGSLLRWAALLFEGLRADVKREAIWRETAEKLISSFSHYELGGNNISVYVEQINQLVNESKEMFVRDGKVILQLLHIVDRVMKSVIMKKRLDDELAAAEKERFDLEMIKYEGPQLVDKRFDLLDGLVCRASHAFKKGDSMVELANDDRDLLFAGEPSARDKSRNYLQKSLEQGFGTFGLDNHPDAHDYSSVLAYNLENAIFDKFKTDEHNTSSEYREKASRYALVRSLRFNLQDPKNPMLAARVLSGQLKIEDLINMTTDELASKELSHYRRQVQQEATKNIVLAGPSVGGSVASAEVDWAHKVKIDSPIRSFNRSAQLKDEEHLSTPPASSMQSIQQKASKLEVPPPPVFSSQISSKSQRPSKVPSGRIEHVPSISRATQDNHDHGHHVTSLSGTESFLITITRLRLSFTTKLFIEQSSPYQIDNFLPSSLTEKGRITLDEFNKFISDKMKGGRWNIVHLKLSHISGDADMNAYKRLYKEYESLDRICMINVTDSTKVFLVTPKFLRVCKCMTTVQNLSRSSTYAVVLTKDELLSV